MVLEGEAFGGQAGTSSMIRNYLGFPAGITGRQLGRRAILQARWFGAALDMARAAVALEPGEPHRLALSDGAVASARAVILACGVTYRRLGVPSLEALVGAGVFYGAATSQARALGGRHVVVVGAGNSGGQAALHLARYAARVTLVARRRRAVRPRCPATSSGRSRRTTGSRSARGPRWSTAGATVAWSGSSSPTAAPASGSASRRPGCSCSSGPRPAPTGCHRSSSATTTGSC